MRKLARALLLISLTLAATADSFAGTDKPTGPLQLFNLGLQPVRVPPNPQGALLLGEATGCYIEFVGRGQGEAVYQFRVGPTSRVNSVDKCAESLRRQPGVTSVTIAR
jgi:hypothetical protein